MTFPTGWLEGQTRLRGEAEIATPRKYDVRLDEPVDWDPQKYEGSTPIGRPDFDTCSVDFDIEVDLGATIVERLWGVNGRKQWLAALAEAEKNGGNVA